MADITYKDVLKMAKQLTPKEQEALVDTLQRNAEMKKLTPEAFKALIEANISSIPFLEEPSPRREDWYDDDGR